MGRLGQQARGFADRQTEEARFSCATAALQLSAGIDLGAMLQASFKDRQEMLPKIQRALMRERVRGKARHWSYDLNRHIALKQALDYLRGETETATPGSAAVAERPRKPLPK